jgi:hypothetical protein
MSFFFYSTILENRKAEQLLPRGVFVPVGVEMWWGTGGVEQYKKSVHMYVNAKMIPVEIIPGLG